MEINFTVYGEPVGKGRPRVGRLKNGASHTYTPEKTAAYERQIRVEFLRQTGGARFPGDVPLEMSIAAYYAIPKSASKHKRAEMEIGALRPMKKPDADNVLKICADSLNKMAYHDDAQIVKSAISKHYGNEPRVEISIYPAN
jgi:Holliday junction resolvase RusA-like endonuclease